ncbi:MAG: glycosyltransferase, partial [Eubacteriales bacterium]|nr:glycosyltransferase [Eubacteriales bacterium]
MNQEHTICLLNDSFPPQIDGVSNATLNYAREITRSGSGVIVAAPAYPHAEDGKYSFPIVRYPSVNFRKMDEYMAGIPFSLEVAGSVAKLKPALLHTHCPIMSTFMARELRQILNSPVVLTYHTKFDVDISNLIRSRRLQNACKKALAANISACDEVWAVSRGAGENLRELGYKGDFVVMPNGVDLPRGRVSESGIGAATDGYDLPFDVPVYLFVGRMMWYKGIRIILDALTQMKKQGKDFRMVFVGEGDDRKEIKAYAEACGVRDVCIFTGAVRDREVLRAWYCRAELFLFPSTFDTNGLVVREAAACSLASVLIKGSCAAEGIEDARNGFLIEENAESLSRCLCALQENRELPRVVGKRAAEELYISW